MPTHRLKRRFGPSARSCQLLPTIEPSAILPEKARPLKRSGYERLVELGAFENERVELLRGTLVAMSAVAARRVFG